MSIFEIIAILLLIAALGGYLNLRFIGLPATIGQMAFALLLSLAAIAGEKIGLFDLSALAGIVDSVDFSALLLHGMLAFLLFAGALHIDVFQLKEVKLPVAILATVGVIISTFITGTLTWYAARMMGIAFPYAYALVFGALISPTDPIAVLSILKKVGISKATHAKIGGESLFNDGVGVVVFVLLLQAAQSETRVSLSDFGMSFLHEVGGAILLGLLLGEITIRLMRTIDDYRVEVLITLALVTGGYALAERIGISAPICMVVSGLMVGHQGRSTSMSRKTRHHLDIFWELLDEILNAVLFLLIGLQMMLVPVVSDLLILGSMAVGAVLIARFVSVAVPMGLIRLRYTFDRGTIRLLTWGGLRGGISVAMALSLPGGADRTIILTLTYTVVIFSVLVQGLTFGRFARYITRGQAQDALPETDDASTSTDRG